MYTAVGEIPVHTVNLGQILGTALWTRIHFQFLMAAIITVCQGKIDALIVSKAHGTPDLALDCFVIIINRVAHVLDLSSVAQLPETSLQILLFNRSEIFCHMAMEAVAHIRPV